jgi:methylglutamate dehydrogenase subunit C
MSFRRLSTGGTAIDRSRPLSFTFDGKRYCGFDGDTLASALLANGVMLFGRSFKYHRPRGLLAAGSEEPNALVTLIRAGFREPNLKATEVEIFDGLVAESQNCFPSLAFDINAVNALAGKLFSAGFYYKTFMGPFRNTRFWMLCERLIRKAAGLGKAGLVPDTDRYERMNAFCDVLVVGGGPAGLKAAQTAAASGLDVMLVDENPQIGGALRYASGEINERTVSAFTASLVATLSTFPNLRILTRTHVWGYYDGNTLAAVERVADHKPDRRRGDPRQRHWVIRAKQVVLATGAIERPIVFPGNDVPGVMLADSLPKYARLHAAAPNGDVVFFANNDSAYHAALDLKRLGVAVGAIIDVRASVSEFAQLLARSAGAELIAGQAVTGTAGGKALRSVSIRPFNTETGEVSGTVRTIPCDILGVSGGWSPQIQLASQAGGKPKWEARLQAFLPPEPTPGFSFHEAGAANGAGDLTQAFSEGHSVAAFVARGLGKKAVKAAPVKIDLDSADIAPASVLEIAPSDSKQKAFVDFQTDVTADDLRQAVQEGFAASEHAKRYTTLGMATDQGRTSNVPGLAVLAKAQGISIPEAGLTRFRPPASGVSFGVIAAERFGDLRPYRLTPMHDWHLKNGAAMYAAGLWERPMIYGKPGETIEQAYVREAKAVRESVGIADVSTLGKIDIQGPDAAEFLDRVYTNMFSNLPVNKARYGLMLREDGFVMDDGTTWRLAQNKFLMTTTTANAGKVMQHLEYFLDCVWPDLNVHLTSVTDQWAGAAVSGPNARKVLEACVSGTDVDTLTLPFMGIVRGSVASLPVMICRLSFSGELAFEIYCGAGHGQKVWHELMQAGEPYDITPYGLEALGALRIEKGHVTGAEIDGRTTAHDLHLEWMLSKKKPYIGSAMRGREGLVKENRLSLVGLLSRDGQGITGGSHVVLNSETKAPGTSLGHVTAACYSPALGKHIALALVANGEKMTGKHAFAADPLRGRHVAVEIVSHHMFDPEGKRMHV